VLLAADDVCACCCVHIQHYTLGGIAVNFTGNYYPAIRITGMTAGQIVSLDDIEVSEGTGTLSVTL
jgi:hypothetical protein